MATTRNQDDVKSGRKVMAFSPTRDRSRGTRNHCVNHHNGYTEIANSIMTDPVYVWLTVYGGHGHLGGPQFGINSTKTNRNKEIKTN